MNRSEGRTAQLPVIGIFHISFIVIMSLIIFSAQVYGSTDIPANVNATPVVMGEAALFAGFGGGSGLTSQGMITVADGDIGTTAASAFVAGYQEQAVYTETLLDAEPVNGTIHAAHPACQDSCSL
jgi:hypothetical protein